MDYRTHVGDPLSFIQKRRFVREFKRLWEAKYLAILRSGVLASDTVVGGDLTIAKYAVILAAREYTPLPPENQRELAILETMV